MLPSSHLAGPPGPLPSQHLDDGDVPLARLLVVTNLGVALHAGCGDGNGGQRGGQRAAVEGA